MFRLIDQGFVSLGNFFTVFLGAVFLSLSDQASLIFAYSVYFIFLLASVAFTYSPSQIIYSKTRYSGQYVSSNFLLHVLISIILIVFLFLVFMVLESWGGVKADNIDLVTVAAFLFFQQIADYGRRISYVIGLSLEPLMISFLSHFLRIILLLILQPKTFNDYFNVLVLTALIASVFVIYKLNFRVSAAEFLKYSYLIRYQISFSKNLLLSMPIAWLTSYLPIYMSGIASGPKAVAILGTLKSLTNLANVFVEVIETSMVPAWTKEKKIVSKKSFFLPSMFKVTIAFTVFWFFILFSSLFLYEPLVDAFNSKYSNTLGIFILLWCSYLFYFYTRIVILAYRLDHNTKVEFVYALIMLVSMLVFSSIMFGVFKFDGVLGGAMIYFLLPLLGSVWLMYRFFSNRRLLKRRS